jgi:predicted RNase H-like nuclease (RuvC/YqgF family)
MSIEAKNAPASLADDLRACLENNVDLTAAVANLTEARQKVERLESQKAGFQARLEEAKETVKDLERARGKILDSGEDPSQKEKSLQEAVSQQNSLQNWLEQLEKDVIPKAKIKLDAAKRTMLAALKPILAARQDALKAALVARLLEVKEMSLAWREAKNQVLNERGLTAQEIEAVLPEPLSVLGLNKEVAWHIGAIF